jgi:hypothetical protein
MTAVHDPVELVRAAVAAINALDWHGAVSLCDPVSLRAFHRELCAMYSPPDPRMLLSADELLKHQPEMTARWPNFRRRRRIAMLKSGCSGCRRGCRASTRSRRFSGRRRSRRTQPGCKADRRDRADGARQSTDS